MPVWHASIARVDMARRRTLTLPDWRPRHFAQARGILADLLAGVGTGPDHWGGGEEIALHVRRRLSEAEIAALSPAWLALPAIDGG